MLNIINIGFIFFQKGGDRRRQLQDPVPRHRQHRPDDNPTHALARHILRPRRTRRHGRLGYVYTSLGNAQKWAGEEYPHGTSLSKWSYLPCSVHCFSMVMFLTVRLFPSGVTYPVEWTLFSHIW